ncbi:branched-chain amino acid ABC transporter permease [Thioalkalivibrio sp. HK1]|uniref:branched-chain amino acid ABC transporter permease n=1 Tax=Thioalkalivibrio sp. HK1 TaxID=1469245 RepID=UPI000471AA21|nr:branched-chain amino acid ABC transporter permease [Thioalkalivibrio sp. HK1]
MLLQILIQGFLLSGLYALIAVGFTLIFGIGRILNLAHGSYLMAGGYAFFWIGQIIGLPKIIGVALAVFLGAGMGIAIYRLIVRPLKGDRIAVEIATLILAVILQAAIVLIFGSSSKIPHPLVPGVVRIADTPIAWSILVATCASWIILLSLYAFIRLSHTGRAMQAVSMDPKGAAICGIDSNRIDIIVWSISGGLGALAGVFFAGYTQLSPSMWVTPLIISVAVVIVGGIGSIMGTLAVAHIIGFMEVIVTTLIAPELRGVFTMGLIIVALLFRPRGLFGREEI